jgi:hypothetical protein
MCDGSVFMELFGQLRNLAAYNWFIFYVDFMYGGQGFSSAVLLSYGLLHRVDDVSVAVECDLPALSACPVQSSICSFTVIVLSLVLTAFVMKILEIL